MSDYYEVTERLYLTVDGAVVGEDDPHGRVLYATPGMRIPLEEAARRGLLKQSAEQPAKRARPTADKAYREVKDKRGKKRGGDEQSK